jgi:hypothetical protein
MKLEDSIHNFVESTIIALKISKSKGLSEYLVAFRPPTEAEADKNVRD